MDVLTETAELLRSLRGVWDEEDVDELDHALQSATHAVADGADDELVLAAALHDLAHGPGIASSTDVAHDATAQRWLTPRFGDRVGWLAGRHVAAKRFLAATEPGYGCALSATSLLSLDQQGGVGVDPVLVAHPWWPDAVRLRRWDDAAKDPAAAARGGVATIDDVLLVADRIVRRRRTGRASGGTP